MLRGSTISLSGHIQRDDDLVFVQVAREASDDANLEHVHPDWNWAYGQARVKAFATRASLTGMDSGRNVRIDYRWTGGNATGVRDL